ncbi:MAG: MFS transporter, partial [Eggerthellaceae bacterium]|nr:MFS transporter [Eggerthellaceae bacterium]
LSRNVFMLSFAGVLAGLGIGTAMSVFQTMAVAAVEPWRRGVATSTYMVAFDLGIAIGSLVGGTIAALYGYTVMYAAISAFPLAAGVLCTVTTRAK